MTDVCRCLDIHIDHRGFPNVNAAIRKLHKGDVTLHPMKGKNIRGHEYIRKVAIVNKPGLYTLIMRSDKPEARRFQNWVTHEVLPEIEKTGKYEMHGAVEVQGTVTGRSTPRVQGDALAPLIQAVVTLTEQVATLVQAVLAPRDGGTHQVLNYHAKAEAQMAQAQLETPAVKAQTKTLAPAQVTWCTLKQNHL